LIKKLFVIFLISLFLISFSGCSKDSTFGGASASDTSTTPVVLPPGASGGATGGIGYQLDADAVDIAALGASPLTMSNNYQTASYTLAGATLDFQGAAVPAGTSTGTGALLNFSSGKKAIECQFTFPSSGPGLGSDYYDSQCLIFKGDNSGMIAGIALIALSNGLLRINIASADGDIQLDVPYTSTPSRAGIELDANAGTLAFYLDGVQKVIPNSTFTPGTAFVALIIGETTENAPANAGKVISTRLITTAEDMTTNFSAGTTDPFGNTI